MTLVEFLLARLNEAAKTLADSDVSVKTYIHSLQVFANHKYIIERLAENDEDGLREMAMMYEHHKDFNPEWRIVYPEPSDE